MFIAIGALVLSCVGGTLTAQAHDKDVHAKVIQMSTEITYEKDELRRTEYRKILIYDSEGDEQAIVAIPFSKLETIDKITGHTEDMFGKVIQKLKKKDIVMRSARSDAFYQDEYLNIFSLANDTYPYYMIYSYEVVSQQFLYIDYWVPFVDYNVPVLEADLIFRAPVDYKFSSVTNAVEDCQKKKVGNMTEYVWKSRYTDEVKTEDYGPELYEILPFVKLIPTHFNYDIDGSFETWEHYGDWQFEVNEPLSDLPEDEIVKIKALVKNIDNEVERLRVLYHYLVDNTRYINVSIETGGMKPYPASYVSRNKYGDCKALTNYFKSVASEIGVTAYYAKIKSGDQITVINQSQPHQQFDHVILYIPLENDSLWLDCTSSGPFNYLGTFTQGRNAFVVDEGASQFVMTPALNLNDVLEESTMDVIIDSLLMASVEYTCVYRGEMFELLSGIALNYDNSDEKKVVDYYLVPENGKLNNYSIVKYDRDSAMVGLEMEISTDQLARKYGREVFCKLVELDIPDIGTLEDRQFTVRFDFPVHKRDSMTYTLPVGYEVSHVTSDTSVISEVGQYILEVKSLGNQIQAVRTFQLYRGVYEVEDLERVYDFLGAVKAIEDEMFIILKSVEK